MTGKIFSLTGGCLCGAIRYQANDRPLYVVHCHCSMCRRFTGAAFATFVGFASQTVEFTRGALISYRSSSKGIRGFCEHCGSSMSFYDEIDPDTIWLTVGSLDHPDKVSPTEHWYSANMVEWIRLDDDLPRYSEQPPTG